MSDEKPFAEVQVGRTFGRAVVKFDGVADDVPCPSEDSATLFAGDINSAVAARERKAAAQALREAATQFGAKSRTAKWINARAAALESGAT